MIGIVTKEDFLHHAEIEMHAGLAQKLSDFLRHPKFTHTEQKEVVGQIMSKDVYAANINQSIVDLVPLMTNAEVHQMPVIDEQGRLLGILTQSDLIAALFEHGVAEAT